MNFTPFTCKNHPTHFAIPLSRPRNRHYSDLLTMTGGLKTESVSAYWWRIRLRRSDRSVGI